MKTYIKYWLITLVVFWILVQSVYFILAVFFSNPNDTLGERTGEYLEMAMFSLPASLVFIAVATLLATIAWFVGARPLHKRVAANQTDS